MTAQRRAEAENRVLSSGPAPGGRGGGGAGRRTAIHLRQSGVLAPVRLPAGAGRRPADRDPGGSRSARRSAAGRGDRRIGAFGGWQGEVERRARDGSAVPVLMSAARIRDDNDAIAGYVVTYLDLRPLRDAERAMRASEQRYRALTENSSDVITLLEPDGTQRYVSPSVTRILGSRPVRLIGGNIAELLHPQDIEIARLALSAAIAQPGVVHRCSSSGCAAGTAATGHFEAVGSSLLDDPAVNGIVDQLARSHRTPGTSRGVAAQGQSRAGRAERLQCHPGARRQRAGAAGRYLPAGGRDRRLPDGVGGVHRRWRFARAAPGGGGRHVDRPSLEAYCRLMPAPNSADHPAVRVAAEGRTIVIHDAESPSLSEPHRAFLHRYGIAASIHLPLLE
ncbi:MAG: PAS domain S-box protein [Desulfosudis oleivorans]|nr:PAS domain S-box protein [Desulfosudis oleivorans]